MATSLTQSFFVAAFQRQLSECCVGGLLLVENFFQKLGGFTVAQKFSPFAQGTVGGDFVMFNFLCG